MTWLFKILIGLLIVKVISIKYKSFYGANDEYYRGYAVYGYRVTGLGKILERKLYSPYGPAALLECHKACVRHPKCKTFILQYNLCFLNIHSRCADPSLALYARTGAWTYDVIPEETFNQEIPTCYSQCISSNATCDECGRDLCTGPECKNCQSYCWSMLNMTTSLQPVPLWPTMEGRLVVYCDGIWQMLNMEFGSSVFSSGATNLTDIPLLMKIIVRYSNGANFESYFNSSSAASNTKISVGDYIGGDAGNYWQAPFVGRSKVFLNESNCAAHYYANNTYCSVNEIESFEDQLAQNISFIDLVRAIDWIPCNANLSMNASVTRFDMFVTEYTLGMDSLTYTPVPC